MTAPPLTRLASVATDLASRQCGTCTFCCHLPDIEALDKPANTLCRHCVEEKGCTIYDSRPTLCRDFLCLWRSCGEFGPEWQPQQAGMMLYRQGPQTTVLVDPTRPDALSHEPYATRLRALAADAERTGGYVIAFVGDTVTKVKAVP
ncbi:hypothetical protein [Rhizobium sp. SGZ-381]|uniref:hypothetical protein n=1 Tax=Rhizobium sp. SGZ-381 TaxID=3342800 RepID=UPI00366FA0B2